MEEYPDYKFMSSQPQLYQFLKERYPALYEKIKERVKEGRWEAHQRWPDPVKIRNCSESDNRSG